MGKGAGNLVTELITSYFKRFSHVPFEVSALSVLTCEVLGEWINAMDHRQGCESALSALLDLNLDDRKEVLAAAAEADRSLLDQLELSIDALARPAERASPWRATDGEQVFPASRGRR
jgi:hypothetical protein